MSAAQTILRSCLGQGRRAVASVSGFVALFLVSTFAASLVTTAPASARETCSFEGSIGGSSQTEGDVAKSSVIGDQLCIGPAFGASASTGFSVFEFVVKFNGPVENADISFKNGAGNTGDSNPLSGTFQKVDATTYVVKPEKRAGYVLLWNFQSNNPQNCADDNRADITVTAKANGKEQQFTFNLCESAEFNRDYTFTRTADQIPADNGAGSGKGRVSGDFTTVRFGAPEGSPERNGRSNKRCVTSITLTPQGGAPVQGDANSSWYSLVNGVLEIPNLDPGIYDLAIVYNDRLCMQQDFASSSPNYTVDNLAVGATAFEVKANEETRITLVNQPPGSDIGQGPPADEPPVCTTGTGLGGTLAWVLCPLAATIANATEFIEKNIILPYLTVSPLNTEPTNPVYVLWQGIRNIANPLFIVAFFIVIFSQATSIGISNYGIKRLLPRIAVVAIGTNLSYFVAAFIIDTFNIFGAGVGQLVVQALSGAGAGNGNTDPSAGQFWALGGASLVAILFKAGPVLSWLFGLIGMAFLIILVAVIVLVVRQMLIILLVVMSPLIFLAWLLPNTEKYAAKGAEMFIQLLIMYPIIVLIFATGKILGLLLGSPDYVLVGEDKNASGDFAEAIRVVMQFFGNALPLLLLIGLFTASGAVLGGLARGSRRLLQKAGQRSSQAAKDSRAAQFIREKRDDRRTRKATTPAPAYTKRGLGQRVRRNAGFNRVTGGYGTYLDRENEAARQQLNEKAERAIGGSLPVAFAVNAAGGKREKLQNMIDRGYWDDGNANGSRLDASAKQRLQQLVNTNSVGSAATARATARTLADTNQLTADSYRNLSGMVGTAGGAQARDAFVAEQNAYNDTKGLHHLGQASYVNGSFDQYSTDAGYKSVGDMFNSLRLGDANKKVFGDKKVMDEVLHPKAKDVRADWAGRYKNDKVYRNMVRESLRMKPDQLDAFVKGLGFVSPAEQTNFEKHRQMMRDEMAGK